MELADALAESDDEVVLHDYEAEEIPQAEVEREERAATKKGKKRERAKASPKGKHFVFTCNNYTGLPDPSAWKDCNYCVFQEEIGEKGTPHLQGYVQFKVQIRASTFTNMLLAEGICKHPYTHIANGSDEEASAYCMKDEGALDAYVEWGERRPIAGKKGSRNDILAVKKKLDKGDRLIDIAHEPDHFGTVIRNQRALQWYSNELQPPRDGNREKMRVHWVWGKPSTGKTTHYSKNLARSWGYDLYDHHQTYWVPQPKANGSRWTGYNYQKLVFIDEFTDSHFSWKELISLLHADPKEVPTDGGAKQLVAYDFIIASLKHPGHYYEKYHKKNPGAWDELDKRIHHIEHLTVVYDQGFVGGRRVVPPRDEVLEEYGVAQREVDVVPRPSFGLQKDNDAHVLGKALLDALSGLQKKKK